MYVFVIRLNKSIYFCNPASSIQCLTVTTLESCWEGEKIETALFQCGVLSFRALTGVKVFKKGFHLGARLYLNSWEFVSALRLISELVVTVRYCW
jgi:hypothetical protein